MTFVTLPARTASLRFCHLGQFQSQSPSPAKPSVPLTHFDLWPKLVEMARYHTLIGHRVEVQYRAGDIVLPAIGTLAADSGRSIFLEERLVQRGEVKTFRWEVPYPFIISLEESLVPAPPLPAADAPAQPSTQSARPAIAQAQPEPNGA
jgi:hypothetical protein